MEFLRGLGEGASGAPPHLHCLATPTLCVSTGHWVNGEKKFIQNCLQVCDGRSLLRMTESVLVEEKKLKVKGTEHPWHEAGRSPCKSMAVEKEQHGETHVIRALALWPHRW